MRYGLAAIVVAAFGVSIGGASWAQTTGPAWTRHTIDDASRGADGVRLADLNGDGRPDIATGWEEGGRIRVCLDPGPARVKERWPAVTVGAVGSPEDAVLVDLDGDGAADVVSGCEGRTRRLFVHWAPAERSRLLDPDAWRTEPIAGAPDSRMWMFCLPMQLDGRHGPDLVVGAKGAGAEVGWLEAPEHPRDLAAWRWHPLGEAGWIMSLMPIDVDDDGDADVVASDRKGPLRGAFWLENPGPGIAQERPWPRHPIGAEDVEIMFLTAADLDRDGRPDLLAATRDRGLVLLRRLPGASPSWGRTDIDRPAGTGTPKAVAVGDLDRDGRPDIVMTCEGAVGPRSGVVWLSCRDAVTDRAWDAHEVSGPEGTKFDLVELRDLDDDGDLDVLTCEETENLGVFWYENPGRAP